MNGQGGWSGDVNFLVEDSVKYEGSKAISNLASGTLAVVKTCPTRESSFTSIMLRKDVSTGTGATAQAAWITDLDGNIICEAGMYGPNIGYYSNNIFVQMLANYSLATWYKLDMIFRCTPDNQCKYRLNDGDWTAWVPRRNIVSNKAGKLYYFEVKGLTGGGIGYFDDIK